MITIERITTLPEDIEQYLTDFSREEYRKAGDDARLVEKISKYMWEVRNEEPVFYAGVIEPRTLIGLRPTVWFLFCRAFRPIHARSFRVYTKMMVGEYGAVETFVRSDFAQGLRLVEFSGFSPTREVYIQNIPHTVYEAH